MGELAEGISIFVIVVLNAAIGFAQEFRAEKAAAALANLIAPRARVVRDGRSVIIPASGVVVGDILVLEGGDMVAADARLIDSASLRTNEAPSPMNPNRWTSAMKSLLRIRRWRKGGTWFFLVPAS